MKKSIFLLLLTLFFYVYKIYALDYVEGEVIVKLKTNFISPSGSKHIPNISIQGSDISVKKIFDQGKDKILLIKSKNKSTKELIEELKQNPYVEKVEPNYIIKPVERVIPDDEVYLYGSEDEYWGFDNIKAFDSWGITTGSNDVVIAVIDTGVDYTHPDLKENIWRNEAECNGEAGVDDDGNGYIDDCMGYDMHDEDNDPMDYDNHGTHVAGIIGAVGNNEMGIAGVNWHVKILPCKIFNNEGSGSNVLHAAIQCLHYIIDLKKRGVNIVASNNSWAGGPGNYLVDILKEAIQKSINEGILFITASGNEGIDIDEKCKNLNNQYCQRVYPCSYQFDNDGLICVTAIDRNDNLPYYSNYGSISVDIAAPGDQIYSTISTQNNSLFSPSSTGSYGYETGTSMATPFVTGAVGLLKAEYPYLKPFDIKATLLHNVRNLISTKNKTISNGTLDLYKVLENPLIWASNNIAIKPDNLINIKTKEIKDFPDIYNNFIVVEKPIEVSFELDNDYIALLTIKYLNLPDNIRILGCDNDKNCFLISDNDYIIDRYNKTVSILLEDNSDLDQDNDIEKIKTTVAFVEPLDLSKGKSSGGGGGCSLSKNTDFSYILILIIGMIFFIRRKIKIRYC